MRNTIQHRAGKQLQQYQNEVKWSFLNWSLLFLIKQHEKSF